MTKNLSRRHALTGALALAAAAVPAIVSAATPADADRQLFDVFKRWQAGKALELACEADNSALNLAAEAKGPQVPPQLMQPIEWKGGTEQPKGKHGWTLQDLTLFAPANMSELMTLRLDYEKAYEVAWAEARAGEEKFNAIVSDNTDLINELGETPAHTLRGLVAKCEVAQTEGLFINFMDFSDYAQGLVDDIERLAPQLSGNA